MQPGEPEEELKDLVAHEHTEVPRSERDPEGVEILREEFEEELNEQPDTGWLEGNWVWIFLVAIVVAIVTFVLVIALA
jgi:hypothetical protein